MVDLCSCTKLNMPEHCTIYGPSNFVGKHAQAMPCLKKMFGKKCESAKCCFLASPILCCCLQIYKLIIQVEMTVCAQVRRKMRDWTTLQRPACKMRTLMVQLHPWRQQQQKWESWSWARALWHMIQSLRQFDGMVFALLVACDGFNHQRQTIEGEKTC